MSPVRKGSAQSFGDVLPGKRPTQAGPRVCLAEWHWLLPRVARPDFGPITRVSQLLVAYFLYLRAAT